MDLMTNAAVGDHATTAPPAGGSTARRLVAGVLVPLVTIVIVVLGLRTAGPLPAVQAVAFGLVNRRRAVRRHPRPFRAAGGPVAGGVRRAGGVGGAHRRAPGRPSRGGHHQAARGVATFAVPVVIAVSVNLLLALPGRPAGQPGQEVGAGLAYAAAAAVGLVLAAAGRPFPGLGGRRWPGRWPRRAPCPRCGCATWRAAGRDRERMQWMAVGAVLAADVGPGGRGAARARRLAGAGRRRGGAGAVGLHPARR